MLVPCMHVCTTVVCTSVMPMPLCLHPHPCQDSLSQHQQLRCAEDRAVRVTASLSGARAGHYQTEAKPAVASAAPSPSSPASHASLQQAPTWLKFRTAWLKREPMASAAAAVGAVESWLRGGAAARWRRRRRRRSLGPGCEEDTRVTSAGCPVPGTEACGAARRAWRQRACEPARRREWAAAPAQHNEHMNAVRLLGAPDWRVWEVATSHP
eukprot:355947-Chlamydomonas_euryale.AAC.9